MQPLCSLENYPIPIVIVSNLLSILIYGIGIYILFNLSIFLVTGYVIFILLLEYRLLSGHCIHCYYYGKTCAFGKGRFSALFFPRGSKEHFADLKISWKDIVPDFLVFLIPFIAGIVLLSESFTWTIVILVILLLVFGFFGNAFVRGEFACKYCVQRKMGCPAEQLFNKTK